jgi:hypothetical protein
MIYTRELLISKKLSKARRLAIAYDTGYVLPARNAGILMPRMARSNRILVTWIPAHICPEQICINPKGVRQNGQT